MTMMKTMLFFLLVAATAMPAAALERVRSYLVTDFDVTPNDLRESQPQAFRRVGDAVYFNAETASAGREPYVTDGTPGGWRMLADLAPGVASSDAIVLGEARGRLIVVGSLPGEGAHLWAFDHGVPARLSPAPVLSAPISSTAAVALGNVDGRLLAAIGGRLWSSDGTAPGTSDVLAAAGSPVQAVLRQTCALPNVVTFLGTSSPGTEWIVASDGTAAGTRQLLAFDSYAEPFAAAAGGRCHFLRNGHPSGWEVFVTDGTVAGTVSVATGDDTAKAFVAHGGHVYVATTGSAFRIVRIDDGEPNGARVVMEVETYYPYAALATAGGKLVALGPGTSGPNPAFGLFAGDGTPGSMAPIYPTAGLPAPSSAQQALLTFGDAVVFATQTGARVRVDIATGTSAPAFGASDFGWIDSAELGNVRIGSSHVDRELVRSDGSVGGTARLSDVWPSTNDGLQTRVGVNGPVVFGDVLVFANRPRNEFNSRLMRTDGTGPGTRMIAADAYVGYLTEFARFGDGVAFMTRGNDSAARLYRTDALLGAMPPPVVVSGNGGWSFGTAGSTLLLECGPGPAVANALCAVGTDGGPATALTGTTYPSTFQVLGDIGGGTIVNVGGGSSFWRTDGTLPGTYLVAQGAPYGPGATNRYASAVLGGRLVFVLCPREDNCVLASTDGSPAGPAVLRDLPAAGIGTMARAGNRLVFDIEGAIWSTDGTPGGTDLLYWQQPYYSVALAAIGDVVHVAYQCASCKFPYLVTDGTAAGTRAIALPPNLEPNGDFVVALDDTTILFSCYSPATGIEVCMTDRQANAFDVAADIFPGDGSSQPELLARTPNGAYLTADDGRHGRELWRVVRWTDAIFADGFEPPTR
ncbi:MAG TPA: hypothetical protein VJ724_09225, partial [Tahibacter sp.]|nr:hypothetical protein [Tahibacter sp.]